MERMRRWLPFVFKETEEMAYAHPYACEDQGEVYLFFTGYEKKTGKETLLFSRTKNMRYFTKPEEISFLSDYSYLQVLNAYIEKDLFYLSVFGIGNDGAGRCFLVCLDSNLQVKSAKEIEATDAVLSEEKNGKEKFTLSGELKEALGGYQGYRSEILVDKEKETKLLFYWGKKERKNRAGSIAAALTKDGSHYMTFEKDSIDHPESGVIYEGDYYKAIPFGEYIKKEPVPEGKIFDIRDYGAVADGVTLCTEAFLAAAEAVRKEGGGVIYVKGGHYCVGTINIYDNTTLYIDYDSALVASKSRSHFKDAFVAVCGAKNVKICGGGKIIGNGEYFVYLPAKKPLLKPLSYTKLPPVLYDPMGYPVDTIRYAYRSRIRYDHDRYGNGLSAIDRPLYNVWIWGCENVVIENIIIEDSLDWTLSLDYSKNVMVKDIVINGNRHVANTDGIDMMGCENVKISHCFISCADDGLCIKAPRTHGHDGMELQNGDMMMRGTSHVRISDCTVITVMNGFKIGTETYYDIEDVVVENCRFLMPDIYPGSVCGITLLSADGSHVKDIVIRNIQMDKVCCPLYIGLSRRNKFESEEEMERGKRPEGGEIRNVKIENITAIDAELPSILTGYREETLEKTIVKRIENISVENMMVLYRDNEEILDIKKEIHENITEYPESNAFGDVPAYGFFVRHGKNISLINCEAIPRSMNLREKIVEEDVI